MIYVRNSVLKAKNIKQIDGESGVEHRLTFQYVNSDIRIHVNWTSIWRKRMSSTTTLWRTQLCYLVRRILSSTLWRSQLCYLVRSILSSIFCDRSLSAILRLILATDLKCVLLCYHSCPSLTDLRPRQNGRLFADDIFKGIFLNENFWLLNKLKYVPKGLINNMAALVQIMAWRQTGDKTVSEAMLVCCTDAYMRYSASMSLMKIGECSTMAAYLSWSMEIRITHWGRVTHICAVKLNIIGSDNGLSPGRRQAIIGTNAGILLIGPLGTNLIEILNEIYTFSFKRMYLKMSSGNGGHLVSASMCTANRSNLIPPQAKHGNDFHQSCAQCFEIYIFGLFHGINCLTHWGRDKIDAILQTTLSSAFSWMKMHEFRLIFHWNLLLRVQSTFVQHWFR